MKEMPYMLLVYSDDDSPEYILSKEPIPIALVSIESLTPDWTHLEVYFRGKPIFSLTK